MVRRNAYLVLALIAGLAASLTIPLFAAPPAAPTPPTVSPTWASCHTRWTRRIGIAGGGPADHLSDVLVVGGRLYYAASSEVGCLDAASGKPIWHWRPPPIGRAERYWDLRGWRAALGGNRLLLA